MVSIAKLTTYEIQNLLSKEELEVLFQIYLHRCFTLKQIYANFLNDMSYGDFLNREKEWLEYGIIEEVPFNEENLAIFLTKLGIETVVENFDLPKNIVQDSLKPTKLENIISNKTIKNGYYRPAELKMLPKAIPHQIHLNQFVLDFKRLYQLSGYDASWEYFDEKYMSMYHRIRPDGLIRFQDTDFFLEEDMNTENKAQLMQKWDHYRSFLSSFEYQKGTQKIKVLFIIDNTKQIENRKNLVKLTAYDTLFNFISEKFDIIVSTRESLMRMMFHIFIPTILHQNKKLKDLEQYWKGQGFLIDATKPLQENLGNKEFQYYVRKTDESGKLQVENHRFQEFIVDYYYPDGLVFIDKLSMYHGIENSFRFKYKRNSQYILVCENLSYLRKERKLFELPNSENVFFTTLHRLYTLPLYEALCQFDGSGNLYCFTDLSLTTRNYNLRKEDENG